MFSELIYERDRTESCSALFPPSLEGVCCQISFEVLHRRVAFDPRVFFHVFMLMKSPIIRRTVSGYVQPSEPVVGPPLLQPAEPLSTAKNGVESASVYNMATRLLSFLFHRHLTNL